MILHDTPAKMLAGQITSHQLPTATSVATLNNQGAVVTDLVNIEARVNRIGIMKVRFDVIDEKRFRHVKNTFRLSPTLAPIFAGMNQTIIRADIQQAFD